MIIRSGTVVTMNDALDVVDADVRVTAGRISAIGRNLERERDEDVVEAAGALVLPGFVQTHLHLCQTLFRGLADDLALLDWLRTRVWPLEAAHDAETLAAAARLAAAELLLGGTTTVLTMETVHDTDAVFDAVAATGLRAIVGKCLMDVSGETPARLYQATRDAIDESLDLHRRWSGAADGRLGAALAPRFALSCTREMLEAVADVSAREGLLIHTHASEQRDEIALVRHLTGMDNLAYLASLGLASERLCAAHCVWLTDDEMAIAAERRVQVLHCPGSNLKLGSGIAPVVRMRERGIRVSLGADGAACNNALDMFREMRLAATLQAAQVSPGRLTARDAVWMATRAGAQTLGLDAEIGSVEVGKKADVIVVGVDDIRHAPGADPYSHVVYAAGPSDVRATIVDGRLVARDGTLAWGERGAIAHEARSAATRLMARAGL
ncbi:MAG TPA: 5'-deoxyadenosine deaminase [Vicinamibacterales bacterium]|nr:5'-deoxyadenosine deaminase [Vicinamibacterales bacterium]